MLSFKYLFVSFKITLTSDSSTECGLSTVLWFVSLAAIGRTLFGLLVKWIPSRRLTSDRTTRAGCKHHIIDDCNNVHDEKRGKWPPGVVHKYDARVLENNTLRCLHYAWGCIQQSRSVLYEILERLSYWKLCAYAINKRLSSHKFIIEAKVVTSLERYKDKSYRFFNFFIYCSQ